MHRELNFNAKTGAVEEIERIIPGVMSEAEAIEADTARLAGEVRNERSRKLAESDWSTKPDVPMSNERRNAWLVYRQALRDVPTQEGFPRAVAWPEPPSA